MLKSSNLVRTPLVQNLVILRLSKARRLADCCPMRYLPDHLSCAPGYVFYNLPNTLLRKRLLLCSSNGLCRSLPERRRSGRGLGDFPSHRIKFRMIWDTFRRDGVRLSRGLAQNQNRGPNPNLGANLLLAPTPSCKSEYANGMCRLAQLDLPWFR